MFKVTKTPEQHQWHRLEVLLFTLTGWLLMVGILKLYAQCFKSNCLKF